MRGGRKEMIEMPQNGMNISLEQLPTASFLKNHTLMTDDLIEINLVQ